MHGLDSTLVAIATPAGRGGLGCVRLSGPDAHTIAGALFRAARPKTLPGPAPCFGRFLDRAGDEIDHGYRVLFDRGRSYTGEPAAELWAHGSPAVLAEIVQAAVARGAEPAGPGEFTYRALRHGRLDLARAEAVADLIDARTRQQARVAFAQLEGALSRRLQPLRESLIEWVARGEAAVEFVDEAETWLPAGSFLAAIESAREQCERLLEGFARGRVLREGATVALIGLPNVGKSSIFNRLLEEERAIVTEIPGTTRDTLEAVIDLDGIPVRLVDTAGLRATSEPIELEGVRRAEHARGQADLVLLVLDRSRALSAEEHEWLAAADRSVIAVANKSDLAEVAALTAIRTCARDGTGIDTLRAAMRERLAGAATAEDPILTHARHAQKIEGARAALARAAAAARSGFSEELVLEDLRQALAELGEITGEFTTDELYRTIFATFCIGK